MDPRTSSSIYDLKSVHVALALNETVFKMATTVSNLICVSNVTAVHCTCYKSTERSQKSFSGELQLDA